MSASADVVSNPSTAAAARAPASYPLPRLLYWGVRRELWEHPAIYIAPFVVAGLLIFARAVSLFRTPLDFEELNIGVDGKWLLSVPFPIVGVGLIVAVSYCLGALRGERRDRSILFWKSLPVSDLTTVLSKAIVPLILMPLITFAAVLVAQVGMLALSALSGSGLDLTGAALDGLSSERSVARIVSSAFYGLVVMAWWHAPIYAWLLLVSAWARRMAFLWAILPVWGLEIVERIALGTNYFSGLTSHRIGGGIPLAFNVEQMLEPTPGRFFADPGLWMGLAAAALLLVGAALLRRYRQPN